MGQLAAFWRAQVPGYTSCASLAVRSQLPRQNEGILMRMRSCIKSNKNRFLPTKGVLARPIRTNRGLQKTCTGTQCHFPHRASRSAPPEPIWSKSAKSSDSRGGLEGQFGDGFRRKQDPNADPTDTQLRASIYGVYGPCALVSGPESCDPERSGRGWCLEGVVRGVGVVAPVPALIGRKMGDLATPSPHPPYHYIHGAQAVASQSRKPPPRPHMALRTNFAKICGA